MCLLQCASESGDSSNYGRQQQTQKPSMTTGLRLHAAELRAGRQETEFSVRHSRYTFLVETSTDLAEPLKEDQTHDHVSIPKNVKALSADTAKSTENPGLFRQVAVESEASSHSRMQYERLDAEEQGESLHASRRQEGSGMQNGESAESLSFQSDAMLRGNIFTDGIVTLSDSEPVAGP